MDGANKYKFYLVVHSVPHLKPVLHQPSSPSSLIPQDIHLINIPTISSPSPANMKPYGLLLAAFASPLQAAFSWKNVHIGGGGGFIPSIVFHPKSKGLAYARTDLGGLYRLNSADNSWTPVTDANDFADDANWHRWGIDALALDPQDPQKVFCAVGMYTNSWDTKNGQIARSYDQGATWHFTDLPFKVRRPLQVV